MLPDEQSDAERDLAPDATPDTSEADVPAELQKQFWILVVIFNVALIAASLGVLLAVFQDKFVTGGAVFFLGLGAFYFGYQRYHRVKDDDELFETADA